MLLFNPQEGQLVPTNTKEYKDHNQTGKDQPSSAAFVSSFVGLCIVSPMTPNDIGYVVVWLPHC